MTALPSSAARQTRSAQQGSFDDLGEPLVDVTFCVLDFETTGSNAEVDTITEVGIVKLRGGECLGTFQTLVNPGRFIPPTITMLTGISEALVARAPRIETVLPSLLEFIGDAVIVAHNSRFDMAFLQAALRRSGRDEVANVVIDTVPLARRLLRDEVANCKLGTLARHFRFPHQPSHRALDDALATGDLLHLILDRVRPLGVTGLDDLRALPKMANHAQASKLTLTDRLPRTPGVYLFRTAAGAVLYVGKATNLRSRVRSYFGSEDRRKIGPLLRDAERIDHKRTATVLEAEVLEMRLIHHFAPQYNREGTRTTASVYVALTGEQLPRLVVTTTPPTNALAVIGPIRSRRTARTIIDALEQALPLRRCARRATSQRGPCLGAQMQRSLCPCAGPVDAEEYRLVVEAALGALGDEPAIVVDALTHRMQELASEERFEEAADTRDRLEAFSAAIERQRLIDRTRDSIIEFFDCDDHRFRIEHGVLTRHWAPPDGTAPQFADLDDGRPIEATPPNPGPTAAGPLPVAALDEVLLLARW
ncbi:MAG: DEDD exonuclease domain-containing protein, partial [Actinobacteria bacterium]|nr:DEDD exonuclease domain-containing protein [Actinomycetota bacterium]